MYSFFSAVYDLDSEMFIDYYLSDFKALYNIRRKCCFYFIAKGPCTPIIVFDPYS